MLIKHKLIANTLITIVSMIAMLLLIEFSSSSLQQDIKLAQNIGKIGAGILQLGSHEKDFLARKESAYITLFDDEISQLQKKIKELESELALINISAQEAVQLGRVLRNYHQYFSDVVDTQTVIGFDQNSGLNGELASAVKLTEDAIGGKGAYAYLIAKNKNINVMLKMKNLNSLLKIRFSEQNYMRLLDDKYIDTFNKDFSRFYGNTKNNFPKGAQKTAILTELENYQNTFFELIEAQKKLGYSATGGLQKSMNESALQVKNMQNNLVTKIDVAIDNYIRKIKQITYILFAVALFFSIAIAWIIAHSIMHGISSIKNSIVKISDTNDLTISLSTENKDELADMAKAFNTMIANFKHLIISVNHSVTGVNNATSTLKGNIYTANQGIASQIQETDMVATALTQMVATIEEIANNTTEAVDKALQTNQNAEQGKHGVDETIKQNTILSEKLIESEVVVNNLAKDSETIGTVLDVIRGIAEQTNLLALNAAIEAARAGEQGRGFAVVADEVRTLASRTQASTKEIENIINSLQSRTKHLVILMTDCRDESKESTDKATQAGLLLEEINHDISVIMDMNTSIATAIEEQSMVAVDVNRHVVSIRDVAEASSESAQQNELMGEQLSDQANLLSIEIKHFTI